MNKWTKEQRQVIDARNRNLLVAAAAGSGKTAVLVERIIGKIMDNMYPVDIDQLLVVTFTNAAAAEMRERISDAIGEALKASPENTHLQKQQTLLHSAQITTIHSFCLYVIRNYFHRIEIEPNFRVGEDGELKLMKLEVLDDVLETFYAEGKEQFIQLVETFAVGKHDQQLKELVLQLFEFSMSDPWPSQWLKDCILPYKLADMGQFEELPHFKVLQTYLLALTKEWAQAMNYCYEVSQETDGPNMYGPLLEKEANAFEEMQTCKAYASFYQKLAEFSFGRLPAARGFQGDIEKKAMVMDVRNEVKDSVKKVISQFFYQSPMDMVEGLKKNEPVVEMLLELTHAFASAFAEEKKDKNLVDYNDLEHFALKILVKEDTKEPTRTALELQQLYEEIMVDEYQDSNFVQETILTAISKEREGIYNMFMVGDVKQSIYRFRMARPELFMGKYNSYTMTESEKQRIDLHKNFRSRENIIETVNDVFKMIMAKDLGNIAYDDLAALNLGATFKEAAVKMDEEEAAKGMPGSMSHQRKEADKKQFQTEVLVIDIDKFKERKEEGRLPKEMETDRKEVEAAVVASKIKRLIKEQQVFDAKSNMLRLAKYSDIVILLRSLSGYSETFVQILGAKGIPAHATTGTGYFSAIEVQTILNLLRLIDNERQDIPMAAVLHSPIVGLSGEELAVVRSQFKGMNFYEAVFSYARKSDEQKSNGQRVDEENVNGQRADEQKFNGQRVDEENVNGQRADAVERKLHRFLAQLNKFRMWVSYKPIHALLYDVMEETGYWDYVYAMPGGLIRRGNLEMLLEKAITYEKTSYKGLFHFIRYMDQLQKYEVDFGEAETNEQEQAVRIMSIHKSKGLEFPIVIVAGMGKQFNRQDIRGKMVLHPQLGLGVDVIDPIRRTKTASLMKQVLASQTNIENIGEELRVLYVALTRAKEKLILTGTLKKAEEKLLQMEYTRISKEGSLPFLARLNAGSFFDWVLPALKSYEGKYDIALLEPQYLLAEQVQEEITQERTRVAVLHDLAEVDLELKKQVGERLSYVYPYEQEKDRKRKVSVSELKHRMLQLQEEENTDYLFQTEARMDPLFQEEEDTDPLFQTEDGTDPLFQEEEDTDPLFQEEKDTDSLFQEEKDMDPLFQEEDGTPYSLLPEIIPYIPKFMQNIEEYETKDNGQIVNKGVLRGTALHRILECFDFTREFETLDLQIEEMVKRKRIDRQMTELAPTFAINKFLSSTLAKRIQKAARAGKLQKEKPFVMGKVAKEVLEESDSGELILVQGIIDVFFEEGGEFVVVDYKTDRVGHAGELKNRYALQLNLYEEALVKAMGKQVKEKIIYSFHLAEEIYI
ncbi:UvrD-helicase domain-containing protein [Lachnospiraceae bacterium ZAX-1]